MNHSGHYTTARLGRWLPADPNRKRARDVYVLHANVERYLALSKVRWADEEIMEVLKLGVVRGVQAYSLGVALLTEEIRA
ncbi:MAG: hypothetical protein WBW14_30250 [Candidatus Acidiferrum sp.]